MLDICTWPASCKLQAGRVGFAASQHLEGLKLVVPRSELGAADTISHQTAVDTRYLLSQRRYIIRELFVE